MDTRLNFRKFQHNCARKQEEGSIVMLYLSISGKMAGLSNTCSYPSLLYYKIAALQ